MIVNALKSKIHRATVTDADINYVGSISIDRTLMNSANLLPYEQVQVKNVIYHSAPSFSFLSFLMVMLIHQN